MQNKTLPFLFVVLFVCCACGAEPVQAPDAEQVTLGAQITAREACKLIDKLPPAPEVEKAQEHCKQSEWARDALPEIVASIKAALKQFSETAEAQGSK